MYTELLLGWKAGSKGKLGRLETATACLRNEVASDVTLSTIGEKVLLRLKNDLILE
jgi:hypothetical protein